MDTRDAKTRLVSAFEALLDEGMRPEDITDALISAAERQRSMAHGISDARRREEELLFYGDVVTVLKDTRRRLAIARGSARSIAG